jgi:hypothetical protein
MTMIARTRLGLSLAILLGLSVATRGQHGGGGHGSLGGEGHPGGGPAHHGNGGVGLAAVGGGYAYGFFPYFIAGPGYYYPYYPAMMAMGPAGYFTPFGMVPPPMPVRGPAVAAPPLPAVAANRDRGQAARAPASDPGRAAQLVTLGDRLFRAGNFKRAAERYAQASHAAPNQAAPQLRLALVAAIRGHYSEAADRFRDAETAEPGWLLTAPDVQSIYGEPTEFVGHLARIESYVQSNPDDRDAWLVLGGLWFLSGRTARAQDVFLRLDDPARKPDVALAAFLFASHRPKPKPAGEGRADAPMTGKAEPANR